MRQFAFVLALSLVAASPLIAQALSCGSLSISVNAKRFSDAELVCEAAQQAAVQFQQCNVPFPKQPIRIDVTDKVSSSCLAIYHCGEDWIEILPLNALEDARDTEGAFATVKTQAFFRSVVVHELAHAAFDSVPCPFDSCIATNEYIAYVMQVMSLDEDMRSAFEARYGFDKKISRDELNVMIYLMAPGRFAQKAWAHFSQRKDPCGYISLIMEGAILLDIERP